MYSKVERFLSWWGPAAEGQKVPVTATDPHLTWSIPAVGGIGEIRLGKLCLTVPLDDFMVAPTLEKCAGTADQEFTTYLNAKDPKLFGVKTLTRIDPYLTGTPAPISILTSTFFSSHLMTFRPGTVELLELGLMKPEPVPVAPAFTSRAASNGVVGSAYSHRFTASGTGPISFAVTSGALPAGLSLNSVTGVLSGVPTGAGARTFTVTASNAVGRAAQVSTVTIAVGAPTVSRLQGSDRFETSVAVSKAAYPAAGVPVVYLASGSAFPDAIAAGPAAVAQKGPLLLTSPGAVPASVLAEVKRLAPKRIVVVGGASAVSDAVVRQLAAVQSNVVRIAGSDRFETARKLAQYAFPSATGAYFASGLNYPDALSAASAAASAGQPVVLVSGFGAADAGTRAYLAGRKLTTGTIVGGTAVITAALDPSLRSAGLTVSRIGGADRFDTSHLVNARAFAKASTVYIASGVDFPDALSGSALAGAAKAPLYLSQTSCLPRAVGNDIIALQATRVVLIGGTAALAPAVAQLRSC